jgi:hypothetical protein
MTKLMLRHRQDTKVMSAGFGIMASGIVLAAPTFKHLASSSPVLFPGDIYVTPSSGDFIIN